MRLNLLVLTSILAASSTAMFAGTIPYPGAPNIASATSVTANGGDVTAYFVASDAADTDTIALWDVTAGTMTPFALNNHTSNIGDSVDFGTHAAGDQLVFVLFNSATNQKYDSLQGAPGPNSADGNNHAYITSLAGFSLDGHTFPSTGGPLTYVGFEDLFIPGGDNDYNDDQFLFSNVVASSSTPEPSTFIMLGKV